MNTWASGAAIGGNPYLTPTKKPLHPAHVQASDLRVALFSGNYNYVRDGANQALNRLVGYLLRQGVKVRVYSPTVEHPAFPATGELVDVPAIPIPGRSEYRLPVSLPGRVRRDLERFAPNILHVSSPDFVGHRAVTWARRHKVAAVASVHTRFDTYLAYYHLQALEPLARGIMRRFYHRCEVVLAPAESTAAILRAQRMNRDIMIWSRGIDRDQFNPERRDMKWRRSLGIADDESDRINQSRPIGHHGDARRGHGSGRICRSAGELRPRPEASSSARQRRTRGGQADGLGHDQLARDPRLQARHRQAPAPCADD